MKRLFALTAFAIAVTSFGLPPATASADPGEAVGYTVDSPDRLQNACQGYVILYGAALGAAYCSIAVANTPGTIVYIATH